MVSVEKIIEFIRNYNLNKDKYPIVKIKTIRGHVMESPLFQQIFGFKYADYTIGCTEDILRIEKSVKEFGTFYEVLVDQDYWVLDGGSRAIAMLRYYDYVDARVVPIRCTESIENMLTCSLIVLITALNKREHDRFAFLYSKMKPVFDKYGINIDDLLKVLPEYETLGESIVETVKRIKSIDEKIRYFAEYLSLPKDILNYALIFAEKLVVLKEAGELKYRPDEAIALACLYAACILRCYGDTTCQPILNMYNMLARRFGSKDLVLDVYRKILQVFGIQDVKAKIVEACREKCLTLANKCVDGLDVDALTKAILEVSKGVGARLPKLFASAIHNICRNLYAKEITPLFGVSPSSFRSREAKSLTAKVLELYNKYKTKRKISESNPLL